MLNIICYFRRDSGENTVFLLYKLMKKNLFPFWILGREVGMNAKNSNPYNIFDAKCGYLDINTSFSAEVRLPRRMLPPIDSGSSSLVAEVRLSR